MILVVCDARGDNEIIKDINNVVLFIYFENSSLNTKSMHIKHRIDILLKISDDIIHAEVLLVFPGSTQAVKRLL